MADEDIKAHLQQSHTEAGGGERRDSLDELDRSIARFGERVGAGIEHLEEAVRNLGEEVARTRSTLSETLDRCLAETKDVILECTGRSEADFENWKRLERECAKLDPKEEQDLANEMFKGEESSD